jgi:lysyl-tRNA synthetase class 2
MKRLLADGSGPLFQLCKVFRDGEIAAAHNPEFTLLEFYRPHADYHAVMNDTEQVLAFVDRAIAASGRPSRFSLRPYERLTVQEALLRHTGIDWKKCESWKQLAKEAEGVGVRLGSAEGFEDVFFHLFLQKVEPQLGGERPVFLTEYPASMASLARLKPGDSQVAERVELYCQGVELGNGFSELTDATVQRARLLDEQQFRRRQGRPAFDLDERFLAALPRMPESGGIAIGLDRVLMLMLGVKSIDEVLLFPARDFFSTE